jgi:hypothetical protein
VGEITAYVDTSLLVPGDVIYENDHIAIVNWIMYTGTGRTVENMNIHLIDATTYNYALKVQNTQRLSQHINDPGVIFMCRLRTRIE